MHGSYLEVRECFVTRSRRINGEDHSTLTMSIKPT